MRTWSNGFPECWLFLSVTEDKRTHSCNCFALESDRIFWPGMLMKNTKNFLGDSFVSFPLSFWFIHTFTDISWASEHFPHEPLSFCLWSTWIASTFFPGQRREILCSELAESSGTNRTSPGSQNLKADDLATRSLCDFQAPADIFDVRRLSSESEPALVVGSN